MNSDYFSFFYVCAKLVIYVECLFSFSIIVVLIMHMLSSRRVSPLMHVISSCGVMVAFGMRNVRLNSIPRVMPVMAVGSVNAMLSVSIILAV